MCMCEHNIYMMSLGNVVAACSALPEFVKAVCVCV